MTFPICAKKTHKLEYVNTLDRFGQDIPRTKVQTMTSKFMYSVHLFYPSTYLQVTRPVPVRPWCWCSTSRCLCLILGSVESDGDWGGRPLRPREVVPRLMCGPGPKSLRLPPKSPSTSSTSRPCGSSIGSSTRYHKTPSVCVDELARFVFFRFINEEKVGDLVYVFTDD